MGEKYKWEVLENIKLEKKQGLHPEMSELATASVKYILKTYRRIKMHFSTVNMHFTKNYTFKTNWKDIASSGISHVTLWLAK